MKTSNAIKKGASATIAGIVAAGGILGGAGTAFAAEAVDIPDAGTTPVGVENVDENVTVAQTPATPEQAQKNLDDAKDNAKQILTEELGDSDEGAHVDVNAPNVPESGTTSGDDGIVTEITGANDDTAAGVTDGTGADAPTVVTPATISDEAANALAQVAKAQADVDAVDYPSVSRVTNITDPDTSTSYSVITMSQADPKFVIAISNVASGITGVEQHNSPVLMNDLYNSIVKHGTVNNSLTYTMTFNDYEGANNALFGMSGFADDAGKSAWLFVSYPDGTVFASGPIIVPDGGIIDFGDIPMSNTSIYSVIIGEPPVENDTPIVTDPVEQPEVPVVSDADDVTKPADEESQAPQDEQTSDEPTNQDEQETYKSTNQDKTPVLNTGTSDISNDDTTSASNDTGTLAKTGDNGANTIARLSLAAGASALLAAAGARRLRKGHE